MFIKKNVLMVIQNIKQLECKTLAVKFGSITMLTLSLMFRNLFSDCS